MIKIGEINSISNSLGLEPVRLVNFSPVFHSATYNGIRIWEVTGSTISIMDTKVTADGVQHTMCGKMMLSCLTPELFREKLIAAMNSIDEGLKKFTTNSIESSQSVLEDILSNKKT